MNIPKLINNSNLLLIENKPQTIPYFLIEQKIYLHTTIALLIEKL